LNRPNSKGRHFFLWRQGVHDWEKGVIITSRTRKRKGTTSFPGRGDVMKQILRSAVMRMQIKAVEQLSCLHGHSPLLTKGTRTALVGRITIQQKEVAQTKLATVSRIKHSAALIQFSSPVCLLQFYAYTAPGNPSKCFHPHDQEKST